MSNKVSELQSLTAVTPDMLMLVISNPATSPFSKNITIENLFASIPSAATFEAPVTFEGNTTFNGDVNEFAGAVSSNSITTNDLAVANTFMLPAAYTPNSSGVAGFTGGTIFWDANYLYVRVSNTTFKRVALTSF